MDWISFPSKDGDLREPDPSNPLHASQFLNEVTKSGSFVYPLLLLKLRTISKLQNRGDTPLKSSSQMNAHVIYSKHTLTP